jgi:hypothetical protein
MRYFAGWLFLVSLASAQTSAGGKWMLTAVTDKLTDVKTEQFYLAADAEVTDPGSGLKSVPTINILCNGAGRFNGAQFQTALVLADTSLTFGLQILRVRIDSKYSTMRWEPLTDGKTMAIGKRDLDKLLKASDLRIEFKTYPEYFLVAQFSPAGLNRDALARSCGLK